MHFLENEWVENVQKSAFKYQVNIFVVRVVLKSKTKYRVLVAKVSLQSARRALIQVNGCEIGLVS